MAEWLDRRVSGTGGIWCVDGDSDGEKGVQGNGVLKEIYENNHHLSLLNP